MDWAVFILTCLVITYFRCKTHDAESRADLAETDRNRAVLIQDAQRAHADRLRQLYFESRE